MIGLLLSALDPFKMILLWGLKKIPLLLEIPALKDHLTLAGFEDGEKPLVHLRWSLAHWICIPQ